MVKFLIRRFIPSYEDTENSVVRKKYGVLIGIVGIICNLILFIIKFFSGLVLNSVAVMSDAFNNFSDMGSSAISIFSAVLSSKAPDRDHPFGHGRIEYVSSLIISFIIFLVGFELFKSSVEKILHPEEILLNIPVLVLLTLSSLVKLWMYFANKYVGKKISSPAAAATATDCINDTISTLAVILATVIGIITDVPLDGYIGLFVSLLILKGGLKSASDTVGVLLGKAPDRELVKKLEEIITSYDGVFGIHDLIVHDYGPGRIFASVHAEVPESAPAMRSHEIIDKIETDVLENMGIELVIHMDPIATDNEETNKAKLLIISILKEIDPELSMHDLRITEGEERINLIFDVAIPVYAKVTDREKIVPRLQEEMKKQDSRYVCVVKTEMYYI
ncbi:MAG: cation transporter [Oscillospiraceae bacterium]|nr:cation transporter [Oscillospiraceae bacterium]